MTGLVTRPPGTVEGMMTADCMARALSGKKVGKGWLACCPAHDDQHPSLSIRDSGDKVLVHCHAGCTQHDVIAALREQGIWHGSGQLNPHLASHSKEKHRQQDQLLLDNSTIALSIWRSALPATDTLVQFYLASRGLTLPLTPSIRFHPRLKHPGGQFWPCMVALVTKGDENTPVGIHRTFLAHDGRGKAQVDNPKLMLGPCGGGAVRLGPLNKVLMVGEGIETCLAAMQATGNPAWAALSTSGFRKLLLPQTVRDLIVLADGDKPGEAAAQECASRFARQERRVRLARPPAGKDFNDLLFCNERDTKVARDAL